MSRILLLFCLIFFQVANASLAIDLLKITDFTKSPRFIKIKLAFDSAQSDLGVYRDGFIADKEKKFILKPLKKYKIKLNALASYSLYSINGGTESFVGELKPPILIIDESLSPSVYFNKHWYHGQVKIDSISSGPVAINGLDIEQAIAGIIGPLARINDSIGAVKSAALIVRSSLFALALTSSDEYHINGKSLKYQGISGEKEFVNKLIRKTEGEVLYTENGEVLYTPIRAVAKEGSVPFELIGKESNAWEKVFGLDEVEEILNSSGNYVGRISSIEQKEMKSIIDPFAMQGGPVLSIEGVNGSFQVSSIKAKSIFKLPSEYFRVYSFTDERGLNQVQFIGSMLRTPYSRQTPTFNLVRLIYESSNPYEDYYKILQRMYPNCYIGRV